VWYTDRMSGTDRSDWASGAPKWAAVVVLGGASVAGLAWSMGREGQTWRGLRAEGGAVAAPTVPGAPAAASVSSSPKAEPVAPVIAVPVVAAAKADQSAPASIRKLININ